MTLALRNLLSNGFINARGFFRSWFEDEVERILNARNPGRKKKLADDENEACARMQHELEQGFHAENVPVEFRQLAPAAARYGIGDDPCRALIMSRIPAKERKTLISEVDHHADA